MNHQLFRVGQVVFNLDHIIKVNWKEQTLYIDFVGSRLQAFHGQQAHLVWRALLASSVDLETGEVGSAQ